MSLAIRTFPLRLGALALLAAAPARANVTGAVEVQGQTTQSVFHPYGATATSSVMSLLLESLSLHYAGLPFGSAVAVTTLGGSFTNVNAWQGSGPAGNSQMLTLDHSVGFLPRRAVPLRLYGNLSFQGGTAGQLAGRGTGPSFLLGGALNFEPETWFPGSGRFLPGLRADYSESHSSRLGQPNFTDMQRRFAASAYKNIADQRLVLSVRWDDDHRKALGDIEGRGATLDWGSAAHQTSLFATETRRSLPLLSGISSDRALGGQSEQRWAPSLATQLGARRTEVSGAGASGEVSDGRAGFTWRPMQAIHQVTFSGSVFGGRTRTASPAGEASGSSWGAGARAGYGRPLGPVTGSLSLGATTVTCDCALGNSGRSNVYDGTLSLALVPSSRGSAQLDHTVALASAPLQRGGDRLENHSRAFGRLVLGPVSEANATLGYDDHVRELLDITTGRSVQLHERAFSASVGGATRIGKAVCSADVRHARNAVAVEGGTAFVAGRPRVAHSLTSGQAGLSWSPWDRLGLQAQAIASYADLRDAPDLVSLGGNALLTWRTGRLLTSLQYQILSTRTIGEPASFQQTLRAVLTRPFDF